MTLTIELPDDTYEAVRSIAEHWRSTAEKRVESLVENRAKRPMPTEDGRRYLIGLPPLQADSDYFAPAPKKDA